MSTVDNKDESKQINSDLKSQLFHILALIDQSILSYYNKQLPKINNSLIHSHTESNCNNKDSFQSKLYYYQTQIKEINQKIDQSLRVSQLNIKESELKNNQVILSDITKENEVLNRVNSIQLKNTEELTNSEVSQSHKASLIYKNKHLKDEIQITRDYHKSSLIKIKEQNNKIINVNNLIYLIKSNIEWIKEQNGINVNNKNDKSEAKKDLINGVKNKEKQINEDMSNYLSIINDYDKSLSTLDHEISVIEIGLKHKKELLRINNMKIKELKRIELNHVKNKTQNKKYRTKPQSNTLKPYKYINSSINKYSFDNLPHCQHNKIQSCSNVMNQITVLSNIICF